MGNRKVLIRPFYEGHRFQYLPNDDRADRTYTLQVLIMWFKIENKNTFIFEKHKELVVKTISKETNVGGGCLTQ